MKNYVTIFLCSCICTLSISAQPVVNKAQAGQSSYEGYMLQLRSGFLNPANEYRAFPMGFKKPEESVSEYADRLVSGRWGGAHLGHRGRGQEYLRDEKGWNDYSELLELCKDRGLKFWIYDESGYPSGRAGHHVLAGHPEYEAQGLFYDSRDFQVRSTRNVDNSHEVEWIIPEGEPFYIALSELNREGHITGQITDLTNSVSNGIVKFTIGTGSWRVMAFVKNRLFEGTHASITGGPYINILDPDAVRRFIEITHETYYSRYGGDFGKTILTIFNDEVSVMTGFLNDETQPFPAIAWYEGLPEIFSQRTGYDIRECLPALFDDVGSYTVRMRCDFYSMLGQQIANAFFRQVREWCEEHNIASTGHLMWEESLIYHNHFYGTVFPSFKELHWPGIDVLFANYEKTSGAHTEGGPVTPKLASSAAHLWERPRTMSESFWSVTDKVPIEDVIAHYAWQAVLGINALTTLTMQNYYPDNQLGRFNDIVGRLNFMLTQGRYTADVAILYPIASVWANFKPTIRHVHNLSDNPKAKEVDEAWRYVSAQVLSCQRDFDYLDEELIQNAKITDGRICIGNNIYSVIVLPHVTTLGFSTLKQIRQFVEGGGTVISWQTLPIFRTDTGAENEHIRLVEDLWENHKDRVIHTMTESALRKAILSSGRPDLTVNPATRDIYYQHRILPEGNMYFIVNNSRETVSGEFTFNTKGDAELWNPLNGEITKIKSSRGSSGSKIKLQLNPRSSMFVVFINN